jgi:hypothetical protein
VITPPTAGFVTIALMHGAPAQPYDLAILPYVTALAPIVLVQRQERKPHQLVGWKEITKHSAKHGGPSDRSHLLSIGEKDPFCPIFRPTDGGAVTAVDVELEWWLALRRKPIGMRRIGAEPKRAAKPKRRRRAAG